MPKIQKILWTILGLLVLFVVIYFAASSKKAPQPTIQTNSNSIKIGLILPLTGEIASLGESARNGAFLAYNDLSDNLRQRINLIFEDDNFQPKNTISAFNKLVGSDKVNIVVCFTSGPCSAIASLADQKEIPLIAVASAPVQKDRKFVFRLEISTSEEAKKLLQFIKAKEYKSIASVVAAHDGIQVGYKALLDNPDFSTKEVASELVKPDEKDFRTIIAKLMNKNPDLIFVGLLPGTAGEFGKQARTLGYQKDFIGFNFVEGEETLVAAQGLLDDIVYTQVSDPQSWFMERYKSVYNKSISPGSAHMYDIVNLVANAIAKEITDTAGFNTYLNSIKDFDGALGKYSSTNAHEFALPISLKTIRDNQFVPYEE